MNKNERKEKMVKERRLREEEEDAKREKGEEKTYK